jgi:hypothetical protein
MEGPDWRADRRLRIVTEELGEVARVLNDLELDEAKLARGAANPGVFLDGLELLRAQARAKLVLELIQAASTLYAWAANTEGDVLPPTGFGRVR